MGEVQSLSPLSVRKYVSESQFLLCHSLALVGTVCREQSAHCYLNGQGSLASKCQNLILPCMHVGRESTNDEYST